jgi:hypothetical protein
LNKLLSILAAALFVFNVSIARKSEIFYLDKADSSRSKYIAIYPPTQPWKACMFLIQGMFQQPQDIMTETDLPSYAAQQGILVIIPTFKTGISSFGIDSATQSSFLEILKAVMDRHPVSGKKFYVGGFSIGGTCAIKYAELALSRNFPVKPSAVFAIDSPLDFQRLYQGMVREVRLPGSTEDGLAESNYILKRSRQEFGGSPFENLRAYFKLSPYSYHDSTQRAIKPLVNLPIRLYTEPDVQWWLDQGVDYSLMNAFDFAAMTNELRRLGNSRIQLITSVNKGFRKSNGSRHPHSWSIVEPKDLVKWLLAQ